MTKPPKSTPHSDIDGVHQEEESNVKVSSDLGQSAGALKKAKEKSTARPEYQDDGPGRTGQPDPS